MLKTVKIWKWDSGRPPPPLFFQNSHIFPFFFVGNVPYQQPGYSRERWQKCMVHGDDNGDGVIGLGITQ